MKRILYMAFTACLLAVSCGPVKHAVHVEMRHPSKSGVELAGKNISIVYLENDCQPSSQFSGALADAFAYTLENDYGTGEGSVGVYRMRHTGGSDYSSKDSLFNLLMETGADVVFLLDTMKFGAMSVTGPSRTAAYASVDSSYVSSAAVPYSMTLHCFDAMDKTETVKTFTGTAAARPKVYSDGNDDKVTAQAKAWKALGPEGWEAGVKVASSFKSQWKHEQYSIVYFETGRWYDAILLAESYDWKGAMDIWIQLLETNDPMKRSCAQFDISVACYMLGDYALAKEWLDLSDKTNKLPISDAMRKRIEARM